MFPNSRIWQEKGNGSLDRKAIEVHPVGILRALNNNRARFLARKKGAVMFAQGLALSHPDLCKLPTYACRTNVEVRIRHAD